MKTDERLMNEVMEELRWEPAVTSDAISVAANQGILTLSGSVPSYAEKWAAERATQRVEGVKAIVEEIEVVLTGSNKRKDADIAQAVLNSINWHVWIPTTVKTKVEKGWVTLTGSVTWGFQRDAASEAVRFLPGITGITNSISLDPSVEPNQVKIAIETALKRDAEIDAKLIKVAVDGGKVILSGVTHSWNEREEAGVAAWSAPGVIEVKNDLAVSCS